MNSEILNHSELTPVPLKEPQDKVEPVRLSPNQALELIFSEYAPNTRRAYARAFRNLQEWAEIWDFHELEKLDPLRMIEYKNHLKSLGKKPSTINQIMSALRKVFKILTEFGYFKKNPFITSVIRSEKVDTSASKGALHVSQLNSMIEANQLMKYDGRNVELLRTRNALVLKFLYLTAARRGEAAGLKWDDIIQDGAFQVAVFRHTKSGKEQRIKLRRELHEELMLWKLNLKENGIEKEWVFPSLSFRTYGDKMTGKGINDIIVRLGRAIGLEISAHYLRHTAITLALELGEPLQKVQSYARHASANTTIRYYHDRQMLEKNPTDRLPMI